MKNLFLLITLCGLSLSAYPQAHNKQKMQHGTASKTTIKTDTSNSRLGGYTLSGVIENAKEGDKVFLAMMQTNYSFVKFDSTTIEKGQYVFKGRQKQPVKRMVVAQVGEGYIGSSDFILENTDITVNVLKNNSCVVNGGPENELWKSYNEENEIANKGIESQWLIARDTTKTETERKIAATNFAEWEKGRLAYHAQYILDHIPSAVSSLLFEKIHSNFDAPTMDKILAKMKAVCPEDEVYKTIQKEYEQAKKTVVGKPFVDLVMNSSEGKLIKLSDFVGENKVTMIDFWASWCGPCRHSMPDLVRVYNKYKDKGFAIVGVSLDNDAGAWKAAIEKMGMTWAQMSDLKGWQSEGALLYNVKAIPATVFIDQFGNIMGRELNVDLETMLSEVLK